MIKNILLLSVITAFFSSANIARADHTVNNGGGLAEQNTIFALLNYDHVIKMCQADVNACTIKPEWRAAIELILRELPALKADNKFFTFKTEAEEPRFITDERVKYLTEKGRDGGVIVNRDLIYRPTGTGLQVPFRYGEAFTLVSDILSYKLTDLNEENRRGLAVTLASYTSRLGYREGCCSASIYDPNKRISLQYFLKPGPSKNFSYSDVLLKDSENWIDINDSVNGALACDGSDVLGFEFDFPRLRKDEIRGSTLTVSYRARIRFHCSSDPATLKSSDLEIVGVFAERIVPQPRNINDRSFKFKSVQIIATPQ
jgi:hypothetical protein